MNTNFQKLFIKNSSTFDLNNFNIGNITESGINVYFLYLLYITSILNIPNIYVILKKFINKQDKIKYPKKINKIIKILTVIVSTIILAPEELGNGKIIEISNIPRICVLFLSIVNFFENFEYMKKKPKNKKGLMNTLSKISEKFEFLIRLIITCMLFRIGAVILTDPIPIEGFIRWIIFVSGLANIYYMTRDVIKN